MKKPYLPLLFVFFPILISIYLFSIYAVNTPWFDDVEAFPAFLIDYLEASTLSDKLYLLLKPNNEHRILIAKLVALLSVQLTGKLNFTLMMAVGNLSILGIFLIFFRVFQRLGLSLWWFVPIAFLLFQPQYHLLSFWAITSLQHQPTAFLVLWAVYLLAFNEQNKVLYFIAAAVGVLLATASMSNGMFGWLAGLGILFLQRRWLQTLLWAALMALAIFLYFKGFTTQGNEAGFAYLRAFPHKSVLGFFAFLGGGFDWLGSATEPYRYVLPIVGGLILIGVLLVLFAKNILCKPYFSSLLNKHFSATELFLIGTLIYLFVNAAVVALLRPRFGFGVMVVSNYKLYPTLMVCVVYLALVFYRKTYLNTRLLGFSIAISLVFNGMAYARMYPELTTRSRNLQAAAYNQQHNGIGLGGMRGTPLKTYIEQTMNTLCTKGLYEYPNEFDTMYLSETEETLPTELRETGDSFTLINTTFDAATLPFVVLQSPEHLFVVATHPRPYTGRNPLGKSKGFVAFIPKAAFDEGRYQISIGSKKTVFNTGKVLKL